MRRPFFEGRAVLALASLGVGQGMLADADTLSEAVSKAYRTNPGIEAQRAAMRSVDEVYAQARAGFGPTVSVTFGKSYQSTDIAPSSYHADTESAQVSLTQPLYSGGRLTARLQAADHQVKSAQQSLRNVEMDFLTRVVAAYSSVRRDMEIVRISSETVDALQKKLDDELALFGERRNSMTDVEQSRSRLASAQTQLLLARDQLEQSRARYVAIIGDVPQSLEAEPDIPGLPESLDAALATAEGSSPELLRAVEVEKGSRARLAEARAGRRFSVGLRATAGANPVVPYRRSPEEESVGVSVQLTQPLFTGGLVTSYVRQAIEDNRRDFLLVQDTRRGLIQEVTVAWSQLNTARLALKSRELEMKSAEAAFRGVRIEERYGQRSTIEVLNAQLELQNAQSALVREKYNEYVSRVRLLAVIGVLSPEALAPGIEAYDPTGNSRKTRNRITTPTDYVGRALDVVGKPFDDARPPDEKPVKLLSPAPLEPTPTIAEIRGSRDIIAAIDKELAEDDAALPNSALAFGPSGDGATTTAQVAPSVAPTAEPAPAAQQSPAAVQAPFVADPAAAPPAIAPTVTKTSTEATQTTNSPTERKMPASADIALSPAIVAPLLAKPPAEAEASVFGAELAPLAQLFGISFMTAPTLD
jgi:outer membrane protein/S-layer protein transport system outer membrane protein